MMNCVTSSIYYRFLCKVNYNFVKCKIVFKNSRICIIYRKVVNRVIPKGSHHKENIFSFFSFFLLSLYEKMDVSWTYCGNHFTIYVNQTIMLYLLSLYNHVFQLFLNKTGGKKVEIKKNSRIYAELLVLWDHRMRQSFDWHFR